MALESANGSLQGEGLWRVGQHAFEDLTAALAEFEAVASALEVQLAE